MAIHHRETYTRQTMHYELHNYLFVIFAAKEGSGFSSVDFGHKASIIDTIFNWYIFFVYFRVEWSCLGLLSIRRTDIWRCSSLEVGRMWCARITSIIWLVHLLVLFNSLELHEFWSHWLFCVSFQFYAVDQCMPLILGLCLYQRKNYSDVKHF